MSSAASNFSRESRSYFCRSSSFHNDSSRASKFESNFDDRPLSRRLVERDSSNISLLDRNEHNRFNFDRRSKELFDEFEQRRRRFLSASSFDDLLNEEFFKEDFGLSSSRTKFPLDNRHEEVHLTRRTIPVQYVQPRTDQQQSYERFEQRVHWNDNDQRRNRSNQLHENRISFDDWPKREEIQSTDVNRRHQRTLSTSTFSTTPRTVYL